MQHKSSHRKLGRTADKRRHLLRQLAAGLVLNEKTETTIAKAKELKRYADSMISKAVTAKDSKTAKDKISKFLVDKKAIVKCATKLKTELKDRRGGYTRIIKMGNRLGDGTQMAKVEIVK